MTLWSESIDRAFSRITTMDMYSNYGVPQGSRFTLGRDGRGALAISWRLDGDTGLSRVFTSAFLGVFAVAWTVGGIIQFKEPGAEAGDSIPIVWLCGFAAGEVFFGYLFWVLFAGEWEKLAISSDSMRLVARPRPLKDDREGDGLIHPARTFKFARADAPPFVIDFVGSRQRLSFQRGNKRIEFGSDLTEPEREWLHSILEAWRNGTLSPM